MNLWRLEWLRLVRTRRLVAILGVYTFFGLTGPLSARYLQQILDWAGTEGAQVTFPPPVPADGIAQFAGNAAQLGLLVVVMVAASALAIDARREMAVFLRTRVRGVARIVLPAYLLTTGAAAAGLVLGTLAAWYETWVLLGGLPAWPMLLGLGCGVLFLAFAVAVVALMAALVRGVVAAAGCALVLLLGLAIVGGITGAAWLPVTLATAVDPLVRGGSVASLLPALLLTTVLTVIALAAAVRLASRREI